MRKLDEHEGNPIRNLWAPWRMAYINDAAAATQCFLCDAVRDPSPENHVVTRTDRIVVVMNLYPYNNGHVLIAPCRHQATLAEVCDTTRLAMLDMADRLQTVMAETMNADGFNVGFNFGRVAGAGLPGHLHLHVVPRWLGDTNFMPLLAGVRVIPQHIEETRRLLSEALDAD